MPQRINASRAVFSVNLKSPSAENLIVGNPRPQNRRSNNMSLRAVSPLESPPIQQAKVDPILFPSDRRMSRRKVSNQAMMPRAIDRPQTMHSSAVRELEGDLEAVEIQPLTEEKLPEQVEMKIVNDKTDTVNTTLSAESEVAEIEEPYLIDRPIFLLSQKYFGTRY